MSKTLFLSAFAACLILINFPAAAQDAGASTVPAGGPNAAAAGQATPAPVGAYNIGVGPINLRPHAYVGNGRGGSQTGGVAATTTPGRVSYPIDKPNSAAAYNKSIVSSQVAVQ